MSNIFVVSGPSGSGKSTVCHMVASRDPLVRISVSATTRSPRDGEEDGREYFFLSEEDFEAKTEGDEFYEYARNFNNSYGTLKSHVDALAADGYDVILEIDVKGAKQVKQKNPKAVLIFIMPPSYDELKLRLTGRESESAEQIAMRLKQAEEEMMESTLYDYVLINDELDECTAKLAGIIKSLRRD